MLRLIKIANSDSESSFYDESTEYQLEDDGNDDNDDRVLAQPSLLSSSSIVSSIFEYISRIVHERN